MSQPFEELGYRGELMRWNYFPLDADWLFHPGNDTISNNRASDNTHWGKVNTEFLTSENGEPVSWTGVGWFRKEFQLPVAWRGKLIAFRMGHFGASEIYLDGKLVARYGNVAADIAHEQIFVPRNPFYIEPDSKVTHLLEVHYSNQHAGTPGYHNQFIGFRLLLASPDILPQVSVLPIPSLPVTIGILFIFGVFFLFVYFFEVKRVASLLTALLLFNASIMFMATFLKITQQEWVKTLRYSYIENLLSHWLICFQILVVYALFYKGKMPKLTWFIIGIMIFFIVAAVTPSLFFPGQIIALLLIVEFLRIIIAGILHKKTGFWILLIGAIIHQTSFFIFVLDVFNMYPIMTARQEFLLMVFPQMGIPLTYALHLAWEFGVANRELRTKLVEVNTLAETSRKQEKEKNEILTRQKETLEDMVTERTKELSQQKEALQNTLADLKSTQAQLIQSEKMASLGVLTAGIAHEIQNPLNFVNNFSEVNKELIEELKSQKTKVNTERDDALEKELLNDIEQNSEKISHHGKRADAIVKGMLQHSRSSAAGIKEATDINALADEYLRLSYHGLRAKDKTFNATLKTDYDARIGKINMVPQDIGRVILNLLNNAFYAVHEKKMKPGNDDYEPTVTLSTRPIDSPLKADNGVTISVSDNGAGLDASIVSKIFQPFFSTKPTGQGTGLGLSLAYDIVKAHGGELRAENNKGGGATFVVRLPA